MQREELLCPVAEFLGQDIQLFPFTPDSGKASLSMAGGWNMMILKVPSSPGHDNSTSLQECYNALLKEFLFQSQLLPHGQRLT